jgi:hypothetical protein
VVDQSEEFAEPRVPVFFEVGDHENSRRPGDFGRADHSGHAAVIDKQHLGCRIRIDVQQFVHRDAAKSENVDSPLLHK